MSSIDSRRVAIGGLVADTAIRLGMSVIGYDPERNLYQVDDSSTFVDRP